MPYKQVPTSTHPIDDSEHQATLTGCFRGLGNVGKKNHSYECGFTFYGFDKKSVIQ